MPLIALFALVLVTSAPPTTTSAQAPPNLVANGSFEIGRNPGGSFTTHGVGDPSIQSWNVNVGTIDYIGGYWAPSHGSRSVDMNGISPAVISQTIPSYIGQQDQVLFDMAGNPDSVPTINTLQGCAGSTCANFNFDITGKTKTNMGWQQKSFLFSATSDNTVLSFQSTTTAQCCFGPALDNVQVFASPPPATLVSHWAAEGNANDSVDANHGTLMNGAAFDVGRVGQGFKFDGNDDHFRIPFASNLAPVTYSVKAWVKPLSLINDPILQEWIFGQNFGRAQLLVRPGTASGPKVAWSFRAGDGSFPAVVSTVDIPLNQFTYLAGTWDGTTLKLYLNGLLNNVFVPGKIPGASTCAYFIGGSQETATGCVFSGQFFNAIIDEVKFYNGALTEAEVLAQFNATPPLDSTPPVITPNVQGTLGNNGWFRSNVTVSWTVTDPESAVTLTAGCGTSMVTSDTHPASPFTCTATSGGGTASNSVTVKRDATPPTITGSRTTSPNPNGWNNTDVVVTFNSSDALSGLDTIPTEIVSMSLEGGNQSVSRTAMDKAGNSASATVGNINIDKTAPTIAGSRTPLANANGWSNTDVTVNFTCSDPLSNGVASGIDTCGPTPQMVTTEGANQSRTGTAMDQAGNSASATVGNINIDKTPPTVTKTLSHAPGPDGWIDSDGAPVTATWSGTDSLSGVASCSSPTVLTSGGIHTVTGSCTDNAGNVGTHTQTERIVLKVPVDIKPGSDPNSINLKSKGKIPVGVKTGMTHGVNFDATTLVLSTVKFAGAPALPIGLSPQDFDGDGDLDMVYHFNTQDTNLTSSSTSACLTGETSGGLKVKGCDTVRIVPP